MNIRSYQMDSKHVIEWIWYRPAFRTYLILLFTLCLDALVVWFSYQLILSAQYSSFVILILFPFLALVMTYYQIAIFVNKTTIEVGDSVLRVFAGPLPFYSPREYLRSDIKGVVTEEMSGKKSGTFNVKLVISGGKKRVLLSLKDANEARSVESELKNVLKI